MKRILLVAAVMVSLPLSAWAQESMEMQLEFVRKLRARGYADLALEQLEIMQKNSPAAMASAILLEQARTRTALARNLDPEQRIGMVNKARGELQEFLQKNAGSPDAVSARLELARLSTFQGQALLSRALREESLQEQQRMAAPAEQMFIQAGKEITEAAKLLKDDDERRRAQLDLGVNMMDQARTYIDIGRNDINLKRATIIDAARKVFEKVHEEDKKGAVGALAAAWLVKCSQEGDAPQQALGFHKAVMDYSGPGADAAQRLSRFFRLEYVPRNPTLNKLTPLVKAQEMQKEAEAWLKAYPTQHKTPAGYGVRFEYAQALLTEANLTKDPKAQAAFQKKAQDLLSTMNESDNDYVEKANQLSVGLSLQRIGEKTSLADLATFDDCYLRAQVEMARVKKVAGQIEDAKSKADADKLEKQRKEHFKQLVRALARAISLADTRTVPSKLEDAKYYLVVAHMMSGDAHRTAIAAESMARTKPPGKRSSTVAGYAIEAYANILGADNSENNRSRLKQMLEYVLSPETQKQWADDPVTSVAHYHLAMMYNKDDDYKNAIAHLQKLAKDYPAYLFAQGQLVFIALEAREKSQKPEDKKAYLDLARKTIASLPKLPATVDLSSATMYFHAKLEEAKFLYAEGAELLQKNDNAKALQKYQQMAAFLDTTTKELNEPTVKLHDETRDKLGFFLGTMQKYAKLGLADVEYKAGNYDKVLDFTKSVVDAVKKEAGQNKTGVVRLKDFQVTGEVLGLALRASVQKGKIEDAKGILKVLENLKDVVDNPLGPDATGVLRNLVVELQVQIRDLRKANNQEKLKATIGNFSVFLDALVKQAEAKKAIDRQDIFFLARCYDSLDQHEKAAGLYARYPAPPYLDRGPKEVKGKKPDDKAKIFTDEEEKELNTYWYVKVLEARQLRESKKVKEAKKILDTLQEHKNARQRMIAEKEQIHVLEEMELFGSGITRWSAFMNNPDLKAKLSVDVAAKEMYFDAYYHLTYCWYKYSQTEKVKAANKDVQFLNKAVDYILRLETSASNEGWQIVGPRFRDLMAREKMLGDAYLRQKGS